MPVYQIGKGANRRSLLYIQVPRTGTTAVDNTLRKHGWKCYYGIEYNAVGRRQKCPAQHFHAYILDTIFNIDNFDCVFMVYRHPVQRFLSEYLFRLKDTPDHEVLGIDQWTERILELYEKDQFILSNHIRPQHEFVVPQAQLFAYEDGLTPVLETVYGQLGISRADGKPPVVNPANESRQHTGLTAADLAPARTTLDRLYRFYEKDFEYFGYAMS